MNAKKPTPSSAVRPVQVAAPRKRFEVQKLEERIAPKGRPFTKRCNSF